MHCNPTTFKVFHLHYFGRIKGYSGAPPPPPPPTPNIFELNRNQGKLCIILKGIYGIFRISLNNCQFTKFPRFASWYKKSPLGEISQNFRAFLSI